MYQALYRKYRPLVFDDVVGQQHIVDTIKNQIKNNKISHAYMFTGTRGTGKTTCAKILARAVNCENSVNGDPCNECFACKGILNGSLLDVFEIDAASNNGVDNIRELREDVMFTPASAKYKVYIIDEVHMLSNQAFNALLKTLEEPPSHIIFVFATTEIHKVPQTILSRCQRFDFKRISNEDIKRRLNVIAQKENITLENEASELIANLADGAMRDALSILDRCLDGSNVVTLSTVEKTVGLCSFEIMLSAIKYVSNEDTDAILEFYSECRKNSKDSVSLFSELCSYYRDMLVLKISKNPQQFIKYDDQKFDLLRNVADSYSVEQIIRCVNVLQNGIYDMSRFKDKHIMAEMTLIKLTNSNIGCDYDDLNARLSKLELIDTAPLPVTKKKPQKHSVTEETKPKSQVRSNCATNCDFWEKTIEITKALGAFGASAIMGTVTASVDGTTLIIHCSKDDLAYKMLSTPENIAVIKAAAERASGELYSIKFLANSSAPSLNDNDGLAEILNDANDILDKE